MALPGEDPLMFLFSHLLISVDFHSFPEPVIRHHFTCDQQVHSLRPQGKGLRSTSLPRLFCVCPYKNTHLLLSGGIFQLRWNQCPGGAKDVLPAPGSPSGLVPEGARGSGPSPWTRGESVCGETHWALHGAMEKLQSSFMDLLKEKVDLTERVEKLKLQFFHLSGKTDTMRKYITPYGSQRAVPKMQHREEDIIRLAQDQEEMKIFVR
ncbi:uncharacterized protein LOC129013899 [Pongo pygmaeus]|uniref:uncharacterized protein LOC129013899 n=1 Tax=Pongo pygmaeus TaxID=9600 RepID=UPI00300D53F0